MKKTFCDRCGTECNGERLQRFTIFDVNRAIDVCENCYSDFFRWLNSRKDVIKDRPIGDVNESIQKSLGNKSDDSDDGVEEFIKDVKNDMSDSDGVNGINGLDECCEYCEYYDKLYWEYPCNECNRCEYDNKGQKKLDHYIRKEENNEN